MADLESVRAELEDLNVKRLVVYMFSENSVFYKEDDEIKEGILKGNANFRAVTKEFDHIKDEIKYVEEDVRKSTFADSVWVVVFELVMPLDNYNYLKSMLKNLSEEELILEIFKKNMSKSGSITVSAIFPILFKERVTVNQLRS